MTRPTYLPSCDCHTLADEYRNQPIQGESPDEVIMLAEEYAYFSDSPDCMDLVPKYLFRSAVSWTLTPIGER